MFTKRPQGPPNQTQIYWKNVKPDFKISKLLFETKTVREITRPHIFQI